MSNLIPYIRALRGPILVTGASGFVGANLFKKIAAVRSDVFAVERHHKSWRLADVKDDAVIMVDLNDPAATKNLVASLRPQTIFDCVAYGAYSFQTNASLIYQTNFLAVANLVELLSKTPVSAFIHAGSSSEYGTNCSAPLESDSCMPNSHYAVSKLSATDYLAYMGKHRGFPCVSLRLYSVYGELEDTSRLIPNLLRNATRATLPPLVHPDISRDFVHIDDVCAAFVMSAAKMHPGLYGEAFNIGTGVKTTIADLIRIVKDQFIIGQEPDYGSMGPREWDLSDWYADPRKAQEQIGWSANITLPEGLRRMATWVASLDDEAFAITANKSKQKMQRSISAIVACYKDDQAIPLMHARLTETFRKLGIDYEIIFVNDGSPDNTASVVQRLSETDARVLGITHSRNFGSQMAFRSGMELATKDAVVLLDGDLQDPPELIEQFYEKWEEGHDVVYGRRVQRDMPWYWHMCYKLFYRIFATFSYVKIPLDAGDFSLIDRRVVAWLLNCPERDLFFRGLRAYVGFRQTGVNYVRPERAFGKSTNNLLRNVEWAKRGIFSFSNTPMTMLTWFGVIALVISIAAMLLQVVLRLLLPGLAPRGVTTLLIAILLFGSLNLFAVGLVGEYVAKILLEVKGRPSLIRSALVRNGEVKELLPDGKAA